jgi:hypothetical protein
MQLLGDEGFRPVCAQVRARLVEQSRVLEPLRRRLHRVSNAHIDLQLQAGWP